MDNTREFIGNNPVDPYENQLLEMFKSCDSRDSGYLDCTGLERLCSKLHLEDAKEQLMEYLLLSKETVTFSEFRDALLTLLGSGLKPSDESRDPSPVREVSPKFVFGQKKYGRRSRPESTDQEGGGQDDRIDESDSDAFLPSSDVSVNLIPDSPEKRQNGDQMYLNKDVNDVQTDSPRGQGEMELRAAWEGLGVGSDGYLDQKELAMVCRAVGMERVADEIVSEVFSKLDCDGDGRISFNEFLQLFRSGCTCPSPPHADSVLSPPAPFHPLHMTSLEINSSGYVSADSVVELWEMTGVPGAASLLQELGVSGVQDVSLSLLTGILDDELRNLRADNVKLPANPLVTYLSASLTLAHVQLKQSKNCLEQLTGERDKLRSDLAEANHRATLLAQEVDDRHARMERSTQKQVKLLEQRHADQVKQLSVQLVSEREQLTGTTLRLEKKLADVQEEEVRLRTELSSLQSECSNMEKENRNLIEQVSESESSRKQAEDEIQRMESLQIRLSELEGNSVQIASLVEQLAGLQAENTKLRDRNDELSIQIESLSSRLSNRKQGSSVSLEGGGGGTKRRGHSPLGVPLDVGSWGSVSPSPRQGKVRRCCTENDLSLDNVRMEGLAIRPLRHSESGLGADLETLDDSLTLSNCSDTTISFKMGSDTSKDMEVEKLQAYIIELERLVDQYRLKLAVFELGPEVCDEDCEISPNFRTFTKLPNDDYSLDSKTVNKQNSENSLDRNKLIDKEISCNIDEQRHKELTEMEIQTSMEDSREVDKLERHCQELESKLNEVQIKILNILSEKKACDEENVKLKEQFKNLSKHLKLDEPKSPLNFNDGILWDSDHTVQPSSSSAGVNLCEEKGYSSNDADDELSKTDSVRKKTQLGERDSDKDKVDNFLFRSNDVSNISNPESPKENGFNFENLTQFAFKVTPNLDYSDLNFSDITVLESKPLASCLQSNLSMISDNFESLNGDQIDKSNIDTCLNIDKTEFETSKHSDNKTVSDEKIQRLLSDNKQLHERCTELETSLDLMRIEFEKCEDYWQNKLDEERRIFDQEQKLSDTKFAELESKIMEYAEMYGSDSDTKARDYRLPTIEEKDSLERQFIDLEEEFDEFRRRSEADLMAKEREIVVLKETALVTKINGSGCDVAIQTDNEDGVTLIVPNLQDVCQKNKDGNSAVPSMESQTTGSTCCCNCHKELSQEVQRMQETRTRMHSEFKLLTHRRDQLLRNISELQHRYPAAVCERELLQNFAARLRYQELRCRHLQSAMKHQQRQTEKVLQASWEQHRSDLVNVQATLHMTQEKLQQQTRATKDQMERLAKSDVLVKELYVENGHFLATIQNLEQHCRYLTEKLAIATSV